MQTLTQAQSTDALTAPEQLGAEQPYKLGSRPSKYVRVLERCANGLVKFEFAVGWPDLGCELALPTPMFEAFCQEHQVEYLSADDKPLQMGATTPGDTDNDQY
jgi:phenol/toluene 2-monooxygenase (NADH) P0/A0